MQLAHPALVPSQCFLCHRGPYDGEQFVDTLVHVDNHVGGVDRVYICPSCVQGLAVTVGYTRPDEVEALREVMDRAVADSLAAEEALADHDRTLARIAKEAAKEAVRLAKPAQQRRSSVPPKG